MKRSRRRLKELSCGILVSLLPWSSDLHAQTLSRFKLVSSLERTPLSYLKRHIQPLLNRPFDSDHEQQQALHELTQTLLKSGLFEQVSVHVEKDVLCLNLKERYCIRKILFRGNRFLSDKSLQETLDKKIPALKVGSPFFFHHMEEALNALKEAYRMKGFFAVSIQPKWIDRPHHGVDLVFDMDEGQKASVKEIAFFGNHHFSDSELKKQMITQPKRWYNFFKPVRIFDPGVTSYDVEKLRQFYYQEGFLKVKVNPVISELSPDQKHFFLTVKIEEGPRFSISDVKIDVDPALRSNNFNLQAHFPSLDTELEVLLHRKIRGSYYDPQSNQIRIPPQENGTQEKPAWFYYKTLEKIAESIQQKWQKEGWIFANVTFDLEPDGESKVKIILKIQKSHPQILRRMDIQGNSRTTHTYLMEKMGLREGQPIRPSFVREFNALYQEAPPEEKSFLSWEKPGSFEVQHPGLRLATVEKKTAKIDFIRAGYDGTKGLEIGHSFQENNLFGQGKMGGVDFKWGQSHKMGSIAYGDPYLNLLGMDLDWRINAFYATESVSRWRNKKKENELSDRLKLSNAKGSSLGPDSLLFAGQKEWSGKNKRYGFNTSFSFPISERIHQTFSYGLTILEHGLEAKDLSPYLKHKEKKETTSLIGSQTSFDLSYPNLPRFIYKPFLTIYGGLAGIGGTERFLKTMIEAGHTLPLDFDHRFNLEFRYKFGALFPGDKGMASYNGLTLGYQSFPGFDVAGVGPRDKVTGDALPGTRLLTLTSYLTFPAWTFVKMKPFLMAEAGSLWKTGKKPLKDYPILEDSFSMRYSLGAGLTWQSPFGELTLVMCKTHKRQSDVQAGEKMGFYFGMGRLF